MPMTNTITQNAMSAAMPSTGSHPRRKPLARCGTSEHKNNGSEQKAGTIDENPECDDGAEHEQHGLPCEAIDKLALAKERAHHNGDAHGRQQQSNCRGKIARTHPRRRAERVVACDHESGEADDDVDDARPEVLARRDRNPHFRRSLHARSRSSSSGRHSQWSAQESWRNAFSLQGSLFRLQASRLYCFLDALILRLDRAPILFRPVPGRFDA